MEEKDNAKSRKKIIYYGILGICALLILAGAILTVYFVTAGNDLTAERPPVTVPDDPGPLPGGPADKDPDDPAAGDDTVKFTAPVGYETYSAVYEQIYENGTTGWWYRHRAVDFDAAAGTEVCSMADGKVEEISMSKELGNLVIIDHGDGLKTVYRFIEPADGLKVGAQVKMGQKIGEVAEAYGSEAFAGEHLHLEVVLGGDYVDPSDYLEPVLSEK